LAKRYFSLFCEADRASALGDVDCPLEAERARRDLPRLEELELRDLLATGYSLHSTSRSLADASDPALRTLPDSGDSSARALADLRECLLGSLADPTHATAGPLADISKGGFGSLADLGQCLLGTFANFLDRIAGFVEQVSGAAADLLDRMPDALQQLWIPIQREQDSLEQLGHVVEPCLEQGLRLDAFDLQLDLAEMRMDPDLQVEELADLGQQRDPGVEVVDLDVDLVDLDDGDVEEDVGALRHVARIEDRVVRELLTLSLLAARVAAAV
jgi:hypothetical protein